MEFRGNLIYSVVLHAAIFTVALALAGKGFALRVPERYVAVTLLEDSADRKTMAAVTEKKSEATKKSRMPVKVFRETTPPEVPLTAEKRDKQLPAANLPKNTPQPGDTEATKSPVGAEKGMDRTDQGAGVSGTSPGPLRSAIPGKVAAQQSTLHDENKTAPADGGTVAEIRAAIERAKNYPPLARKRGAEGTVTAEFTINAAGHPENIRIIQSSGYDILDSAAMKTILRASPFPAVRGNIEVPITFRLGREN